jgi:hypothetical protein
MNLYPVSIALNDETRRHVLESLNNPLLEDSSNNLKAHDEGEFVDILEQVFSAPNM